MPRNHTEQLPLLFSASQIAGEDLDVLVVGSGPAGVALAGRLYEKCPHIRIGVLERGPLLLPTHFYNLSSSPQERELFMSRYMETPWEGDMAAGGGAILPTLGGRGMLSCSHLRRFDPVDLDLWQDGIWPFNMSEIEPYYTHAEAEGRVTVARIDSGAQEWAARLLSEFGASPQPMSADFRPSHNFDLNRGYNGPLTSIWRMALADAVTTRTLSYRRLLIATSALATEIVVDPANKNRVAGVVCRDLQSAGCPEVVLKAGVVVLAASPIESTRLILNSRLGGEGTPRPAAGKYLAEHIYYEWDSQVSSDVGDEPGQAISLVLPPPGSAIEDRYQVEIRARSSATEPRILRVRMAGAAAMDPSPTNCVSLSTNTEYGTRRASTSVTWSRDDRTRVECMRAWMADVVAKLGAARGAGPRHVGHGGSYHEAGTLRMGTSVATSATDANGQLHGMDNLFVADASSFPCVGVANPRLTVTALAYRLADWISGVFGSRRATGT